MDLLGGYGSDSDNCDSGEESNAAKPALDLETHEIAPKKKKVNISRLPIQRPSSLDVGRDDEEEAPLKKRAELDALRPQGAQSLVSLLPAPKTTLGSALSDGFSGMGGMSTGARIDLSGIKQSKEKPRETSAPAIVSENDLKQDFVFESEEVPADLVNHPMFSVRGGPVPREQDGPSIDDLEQMRSTKAFTKIAAEELQNPNWQLENSMSGGPGLHKGKTVPVEMSNYDTARWQQSTHSNPSRVQKRKHQINWLAQEAMDKEAEMLDRNAQGRLTKAQTQMKYGW